MQGAILVFLGAGLGGVLRHAVNVVAVRSLGANFPYATLAVNVTGSCVMGLLAGWLTFRAGAAWSVSFRLFALTGVLGGYTTFSAFSLDAVLLWERGEALSSLLFVGASVVGSLGALVLGLAAVRALS